MYEFAMGDEYMDSDDLAHIAITAPEYIFINLRSLKFELPTVTEPWRSGEQ